VETFSGIFSHVVVLYDVLRSKRMGISSCRRMINSVKEIIRETRSDGIQKVCDVNNNESAETQIKRRNEDPLVVYKRLFN
jgi:hypothetical protein